MTPHKRRIAPAPGGSQIIPNTPWVYSDVGEELTNEINQKNFSTNQILNFPSAELHLLTQGAEKTPAKLVIFKTGHR